MMKRTIYIGNPAYLSLRLKQMEVRQPSDDREMMVRTIPIEDIGVVLENNCAVVTCSATHMPSGLLLPLDGHTL